MSVSSNASSVSYAGNGATKAFPITFDYRANSHVVVEKTENGVPVTLSEGAHYSISAGNVVFTSALAVGVTLRIRRSVPFTQLTNFRSLGTFNPKLHEDALDLLTMQVQQVDAGRAEVAASVLTEASARVAGDAAERAYAAAEFAKVRTELDTAPGSTVDARTVLASGGATARTLADHAADVLGIKDFGASQLAAGATNDAAITAALAALDFAFVPKGLFTVTVLPDLSRLWGPGQLVLSGVTVSLNPVPVATTPENLFPNSQWQIGTGHGWGTKMNSQGTGSKNALVVSAYETGTNTPLCTCADVADLKVGDLLSFSSAAEDVFEMCFCEVLEIGGGGFRVGLPLGLKATASAACTALPVMSGGSGSEGSGDSFDWWSKDDSVPLTGTLTFTNGSAVVTGVGSQFTAELANAVRIKAPGGSYVTVNTVDSNTQVTLTTAYTQATAAGVAARRTGSMTWREDHAVNVRKGSTYSCGFKKALNPAEYLWSTIQPIDLERFRGKRVVAGFGVMHKVKGGSGTWRVIINSDGTGGGAKYSPYSTAGVGVWQWLENSAVIPEDATWANAGIEFAGAKGDVYYVSQPMLAFGRYLGPWNYKQPKGEYLIPIVHAQLFSFLNSSPRGPSSLASTVGKGLDTELQGTDNGAFHAFPIRVHGESRCCIAPTIREMVVKVEGRCESEGDGWGLSNNYKAGEAHVFGPLMYSVRGGFMMSPQKASVPLDQREKKGWCYGHSGFIPMTGTMTFTNGSATVTGVGTRFLTELSTGMLIHVNGEPVPNKMYRVKSRASDTSLTLGVPGGADATFDEPTVAGVGALKCFPNMYNYAIEANGFVLN